MSGISLRRLSKMQSPTENGSENAVWMNAMKLIQHTNGQCSTGRNNCSILFLSAKSVIANHVCQQKVPFHAGTRAVVEKAITGLLPCSAFCTASASSPVVQEEHTAVVQRCIMHKPFPFMNNWALWSLSNRRRCKIRCCVGQWEGLRSSKTQWACWQGSQLIYAGDLYVSLNKVL